MNLSEIRKLKTGDMVEFTHIFPPFTVGKQYVVKKTDVGRFITDDNGLGQFLAGPLYTEIHFRRINERKSF